MEHDLEKTLAEVQTMNQQLQAIMMQKQTMTVQQRELELALEEIEKSKDDVYKSIGPIIVKSSKETIKKELDDTNEQIGVHLKTLEKQEKRMKETIMAMQSKLQQLMKTPNAGA